MNRRTDETYGGRAGRDMETEVGPVTKEGPECSEEGRE